MAVRVYDCIGANVNRAPTTSILAGYTTGSGSVPWSAAQWDAHPTAVRICQDPTASDETADVLDIEKGAATFSVAVRWYKNALANYVSSKRKGQRHPAFYVSEGIVAELVSSLTASGIKNAPLWVAHWGIGITGAAGMLNNGPPVIGVQYQNDLWYDYNLFNETWLNSYLTPVTPPSISAIPTEEDMMKTLVRVSENGGIYQVIETSAGIRVAGVGGMAMVQTDLAEEKTLHNVTWIAFDTQANMEAVYTIANGATVTI